MLAKFESHSLGRNGLNWGASVHTVQDLEVDKSGQIIYAEGTVTLRRNKQIVGTHTIDNRASIIVNGRPRFRVGAIIYKQAEYKACLRDVLQQLIHIGNQNS